MAEICCDVVSPREASVEVTERSPRTARRRRMEIRRFRFVGGAQAVASKAPSEPITKRQKLESPPPPPTPPQSCVTTRVEPEPESGFLDVCPKYGITFVCGRRREMEDAVSVRLDFFRRETKYHFFGVYDGHGCSHVAASCKEKMHEMVAEELANGGSSQFRWREIMGKGFSRMDAEVGSNNNINSSCKCDAQTRNSDNVGSTALVAVVGPEKIVVANCGDSRAVLCRRGVAIPLSDDHKPDRPDELNRIEAAGGRVIYWEGARVQGVLAMSRAIGDDYLKPFVISEPEVTITDRSDDDECLILASDGLWDVVTNQMACNIARMCLRGRNGSAASVTSEQGTEAACSDASMLLTKVALARHSADNISVVVVDLRRRSS